MRIRRCCWRRTLHGAEGWRHRPGCRQQWRQRAPTVDSARSAPLVTNAARATAARLPGRVAPASSTVSAAGSAAPSRQLSMQSGATGSSSPRASSLELTRMAEGVTQERASTSTSMSASCASIESTRTAAVWRQPPPPPFVGAAYMSTWSAAPTARRLPSGLQATQRMILGGLGASGAAPTSPLARPPSSRLPSASRTANSSAASPGLHAS